MQTLSPKEFQRIKENCIRGLSTPFGGQHIFSFAGRYCTKAECLGILYLLHGVKNVGCHVQHWSGRKEVDSFMTWNGNLVVDCKDEDSAEELFRLTKLAFTNPTCGWRAGKSFGLGYVPTPEKEKEVKLIADLIIYFHSVKSDFKKNVRIVKQSKTTCT